MDYPLTTYVIVYSCWMLAASAITYSILPSRYIAPQ